MYQTSSSFLPALYFEVTFSSFLLNSTSFFLSPCCCAVLSSFYSCFSSSPRSFIIRMSQSQLLLFFKVISVKKSKEFEKIAFVWLSSFTLSASIPYYVNFNSSQCLISCPSAFFFSIIALISLLMSSPFSNTNFLTLANQPSSSVSNTILLQTSQNSCTLQTRICLNLSTPVAFSLCPKISLIFSKTCFSSLIFSERSNLKSLFLNKKLFCHLTSCYLQCLPHSSYRQSQRYFSSPWFICRWYFSSASQSALSTSSSKIVRALVCSSRLQRALTLKLILYLPSFKSMGRICEEFTSDLQRVSFLFFFMNPYLISSQTF